MLSGLNSDWISKWLDDIGLPQYKDQFAEACIDGRMLNQLTVVCRYFALILDSLGIVVSPPGVFGLFKSSQNL